MHAIRRGIVVMALFALAPAAFAQAVRGTITDATNAPVAGAVVQLLDTASHIVARQLSSERGTFRLAAPRAATYRLQTLRIGFTPLLSEPVVLAKIDTTNTADDDLDELADFDDGLETLEGDEPDE